MGAGNWSQVLCENSELSQLQSLCFFSFSSEGYDWTLRGPPGSRIPSCRKTETSLCWHPAFLGPVDASFPSQQHFSVCHCHPKFGLFAFNRWILSQPLTYCCIWGKHLITLFHFFLNLGSVSNWGPSVSELVWCGLQRGPKSITSHIHPCYRHLALA